MRVLAFLDNASVMNILVRYLDDVDLAVEKRWVKLGAISTERARYYVDWPIWKMREFLRDVSKNYDLIHTTAWRGAMATYLESLPYTVHLQGGDIRREYWRDPLRRAIYRDVLLASRGTAVSTPDLIDYAKKAELEGDPVWIPNPLDPEILSNLDESEAMMLREELLGGKEILIFSPTRIDPIKGITKIFEVMRMILEEYRNVAYVQVSWTKGMGSKLIKLAPKGTKFLPIIPRNRLPLYYMASDIVLGQMGLGMYGMTEIEAASLAKPVLVYVNKSYFNNDIPFQPHDNSVSALKRSIEEMIVDERRRREYGESLREYVSRNHDPRSISEKLRIFWERSLNQESMLPRMKGVASLLTYAFDSIKVLKYRWRSR